jgi:hypothetical protein
MTQDSEKKHGFEKNKDHGFEENKDHGFEENKKHDFEVEDRKSQRQDHLGELVEKQLDTLDEISASAPPQLEALGTSAKDYLVDADDGVLDDAEEHEDLDELRGGIEPDSAADALSFGSAAEVERIGMPEDEGGTPADDVATLEGDEFYVRRGGNVKGPYKDSTVVRNVGNGKLKGDDEISQSSEGPWQPLDKSRFATVFE